ncbi:hypothetical protein [uncultured virus]|uniref:Uncharacterized protein n=1 Tax=uncultured virus TaxID=340016 RepID=A0A218MN20_9VIRU|nr:hypothetical protein [uncultured virus]
MAEETEITTMATTPPPPTTEPSTPRVLDVDETNKGVLDITGQDALMDASNIPSGAKYTPTNKEVETDELLTDKTYDEEGNVVTDKTLGVKDKSPIGTTADDVADVTTPTAKAAAQVDNVERTFSNITDATAAQGTVSEGVIIDPNQIQDNRTKEEMFERGSLAEAKTQTLAAEASTKYQIEELMRGLGSGNLPPWASPAARAVQGMMNQRGLSSSSMAAAAMVQAIMESSIPIAQTDAQSHARLQLQNLSNEQQTALANAATIAAMDRANLDVRMKSAQINSQSLLQMDLANLTNEQASATLTYQVKAQSLFSDQSAANAASQFNATSQNQVNQYYDTLGTTVDNNNANREVALNEFNADQANSMAKFTSSLEDQREKFNSNLQNLIDQSNAIWRRNVNTINNASQNAANKYNAEVVLGLGVDAMNNLWQKYRDEASQSYTAGENAKQRAHALAVTAIANQFSMDLFRAGIDADESQSTSRFFGGLLNKVIGAGLAAFTFDGSGGGDDYDSSYDSYFGLDDIDIDEDLSYGGDDFGNPYEYDYSDFTEEDFDF